MEVRIREKRHKKVRYLDITWVQCTLNRYNENTCPNLATCLDSRLEWILELENRLWKEFGDKMQTSIYSLFMSYYYVWERERERGIQLCNMADRTTAVGTITFDRWVIHWVLQISIIYGSSTTWVSTYVPQCHCLCIPLLEYWVQCPHCNPTLNIITSLSHTQMIWPKYKDVPDSKIQFDIKQNSN